MIRAFTEVHAERLLYRNSIDLAVIQKREDGSLAVGLPITMKVEAPDREIIAPTLQLNNGEAQFLMDELWRCGLRPSEGTGSAGSLAATERHLRDMQAIALGLLRKVGVNA